MAEHIDFYFDFASPYGYLAAQRIDALAERHGRVAHWRPTLIGAAFKQTGARPLLGQPMKGDYALRDIARAARRLGVPVQVPQPFPFLSVAAARAFYWQADRDETGAISLARALYHVAFGEGGDIASAQRVAEIANATCGHPVDEVLAALNDPGVEDRLRAEVDAALARGVFGSPFVFVDDEPFWGFDRLPDIEAWLEGGW